MKKLFIVGTAIMMMSCLTFGDYAKDAAAQEKEKPQYGGIFKKVEITRQIPAHFGWPLALGSGMETWQALRFYEGLLKAAPQPKCIEPQLATSWELSPDKKSYTFHLRKGVKFHDGTPFNAQAVKYNFDLVLGTEKTIFKNVTSVEVVDDYTVRMNMSKFNVLLLSDLTTGIAFIASPTAMKKLGEEGMGPHPVGTGPFKIKSFKRGVFLEAEKFDDYWQKGLPYLDGIRVDWVKDPMVALVTFKRGDAHAVQIQTKDSLTLMKEGYKVIPCAAVNRMLAPDSRNPDSVFANKLVREAVAYAINRRAIAKAVGHGMITPSFQVAYKKSYAYNPALDPREYNPEKAKQLLTKAGYPNGFKCTIVAMGSREKRMLNEAIQANLAKVGIEVELKFVDSATMGMYRLKGGLPTNSLLESPILLKAEFLIALKDRYVSTSRWLPQLARPEGFDDLVWKAIGAESIEEKVKTTQAAIKKLYDDVTLIPLQVGVMSWAYQPEVQNMDYCKVDPFHTWPTKMWLKQK
ncbi:MAG: hypothetical protein B1H13_00100 [Desulfobacteraceae bacterium 4484_190.3]|nr:MAG: hypothetical protein B1H13_00100 [Desulfobacteraceae bacterium 4484_190.3]RKY96607.1 MAG: hypothetical protein DRQ06_00995 [Candidatus Hydrothermae bacterium]